MRHELAWKVGHAIAQTLLPMGVETPAAASALVDAAGMSNALASLRVPADVAAEPSAGVATAARDDLRPASRTQKDPR